MACFMERGTTPDVIDEFIRCVRKGARPSAMCFSRHVGTGSSAQVVDGDLIISSQVSDTDVVGNVCSSRVGPSVC